jgi:hypothetical protein
VLDTVLKGKDFNIIFIGASMYAYSQGGQEYPTYNRKKEG